ncbi:MAG: cytochrome c peroxidase [Gammaproteobacteria bacterium]
MIASLRARFGAPVLFLGFVCAFVWPPSGVQAHKKAAAETPIVLAPGYAALDYDAPVAGTYELPSLGAATDAPFVDENGKRGRLHELLADKVSILTFIYTQCDDVNGCPLATFVMAQVVEQLQSDPRINDKLGLVSFSFDLDNDTPAVLKKYAKSFRPTGANWKFVVAPNAADLKATLKPYQQSVMRSGGHAFAHILRVFLVDSELNIRNIYSTSFLHADTVAADIRTVLMAQGDLDPIAPAPGYRPAANANLKAAPATLGLPQEQIQGTTPTAAQIALGEQMFFDRRLSLNRTISCAMCHIPAQGFTVNELATAVGIEGRTVKRNAPTLLNVGHLSRLFHDARENRLDQQVWSPLLAHNEMDNPSVGYVIENLKSWPGYAEQFQQAFGRDITMESVGAAFAAYQRSLIAGGSAFDRFYFGGDQESLTTSQRRGFELFTGKAGCAGCHTIGEKSALFTDELLHNTGLGFLASMRGTERMVKSEVTPGTTVKYDLSYVAPSAEQKPNDLGRYEVTEDPRDRWKYRTPTLRNVELTMPYMHDGSLSTLADVVGFYNDGGVPNELLDPLIRPRELSPAEQSDLVAFLRSLTSPNVASLVERAQAAEINNPGETR